MSSASKEAETASSGAKMAANSSNNNNNDKKEVMQSNLPLLFANGSPSSLESMSLNELQHFMLFLLKCESGQDITSLTDIDPPTWWPNSVTFEDGLLRKSHKKGMWSSVMRKMIQKCYHHHNSAFLLEFSRKLMTVAHDTNKIRVVDNGDGTRSMWSIATDKLLVTFRSENQDYDMKMRQQLNSFTTQSPLKRCCNLTQGINASDPRLPQCKDDSFECDNCGIKLDSLQDVLVHERNCQDVSTERAEKFHQKYFNYLGLQPAASPVDESETAKIIRPKPNTYAKFLSIDISSPLGQYIYNLSKATSDTIDISTLCSAERKSALRSLATINSCLRSSSSSSSNSSSNSSREPSPAPLIVEGGHGEEFPVTYRGHRSRNDRKQDPRSYCFTEHEKAVKKFTLTYGLTPQSMKLYRGLRHRSVRISVRKVDLTKLTDIVKEWLANSDRRRQKLAARKKSRQLAYLKERARRFEPYVPKLSSGSNPGSRSSLSVLQSFTSAVQQLCSPEKDQQKTADNKLKRGRRGRPRKSPHSRQNGHNVQCIDLCTSSSSEDDDDTNW